MFLFTINLELELELFRHQHRHQHRQQQGRRDFFSYTVSFISKTIMNAWECFGNCGGDSSATAIIQTQKIFGIRF